MEYLERAKNEVTSYEQWYDASPSAPDTEIVLMAAQAYAAIAQAENASSQAHSLERIAESLERVKAAREVVAMAQEVSASSDNVASLKTELAAALGDIIEYRRMRYADSAPEEARYRQLTGHEYDDE
jgi:response regulator RpfG family c-di-GMP phosphodiesterase